MSKYIEQVKEKIKECREIINQIPNWDIEDFRKYYVSKLPEIMDSVARKGLTKQEIEKMAYAEIEKYLANDVEIQRSEVPDYILREVRKLEKFLEYYSICCREYGEEFEVSNYRDVIEYPIGFEYTTIKVPKIKLSLLCDRDNNRVLKKNLVGNRYIHNDFMSGPSFYEVTPTEVIFYPSVDESPIAVGPYDPEAGEFIWYLYKSTLIPYAKGKSLLFNEPRREVMIDDYDSYNLNNPYAHLLGVLPDTATVYKTIKSEGTERQTVVAYLINITDGTIQTDIVDVLSGKRYEVDKTITQRDAINKVYETVLGDLEPKNSQRILTPNNSNNIKIS